MATSPAEIDAYRPSPAEIVDGVVYPSSDGEPLAENDLQYSAITDTVSTLRAWFIDRSDVYVAGDMFVYYYRGDNSRRVAPDVFAAFGASGKHPRYSWLIWNEGGVVPRFVMEVAAESSWKRDATEKRDIYEEMEVEEYWRFDPEGGKFFSPPLVGDRLENGLYTPIHVYTDEQGILRGHSVALGLDICVMLDSQLRLYDPLSGQWLLSPAEAVASQREIATAQRETVAVLRETTASLREKDTALQETTASLQEKDVALQETTASLQETAATLRDRDAALQETVATLQDRDAEIERLRERNAEIERLLRAARGEG